MPEVGSLLEICRKENAADFEWRIPASDTKELERDGYWRQWLLWSPSLSFAGWKLELCFEKMHQISSTPLQFRLRRLHTPSSPSPPPLVRYWLGVVKGDGGREEEEIGRGPKSPPARHPWLSLPILRGRWGQLCSGTLSFVVRLRSGPETDNEMKSLLLREEPTPSLEPAAKKFKETEFKASIQNDASACDSSRGLESLSSDLSKMLDDETTSDVKLSCNERTIFAHKNILTARSVVFADMFRNKMEESETGIINLSDMDVPVYELFVKYLYSGKVVDLSEDNVSGLYDAADKYAVRELKEECSRWICRNLTEENCFGFLILAEAHGDQAMKDTVVGYFLKNVELLNSETWRSFSEQHPKLSNCVYQKCFSEKFFK